MPRIRRQLRNPQREHGRFREPTQNAHPRSSTRAGVGNAARFYGFAVVGMRTGTKRYQVYSLPNVTPLRTIEP